MSAGGCWFCTSAGRVPLNTGAPVCAKCARLLAATREWLARLRTEPWQGTRGRGRLEAPLDDHSMRWGPG